MVNAELTSGDIRFSPFHILHSPFRERSEHVIPQVVASERGTAETTWAEMVEDSVRSKGRVE